MIFCCPKCPGECEKLLNQDAVRCTRCGRVDSTTRLIRLGQFKYGAGETQEGA